MGNIENLIEYYPSAIKAEQRDNDILILRKLEKPEKSHKYKNGKKRNITLHYQIEYLWLNAETGGVQGSEYSYWNKKEVDLKKSLFDNFRLFA